jgi:hypothetical protein
MRTTVLAYVIAAVGLLMLIFGACGLFILNNAEVDVALTDEAIVLGVIGALAPIRRDVEAVSEVLRYLHAHHIADFPHAAAPNPVLSLNATP